MESANYLFTFQGFLVSFHLKIFSLNPKPPKSLGHFLTFLCQRNWVGKLFSSRLDDAIDMATVLTRKVFN